MSKIPVNLGDLKVPDAFRGWTRNGMRRDLMSLFSNGQYEGRSEDAITGVVHSIAQSLGADRPGNRDRYRLGVAQMKRQHRRMRRSMEPFPALLRDRLFAELGNPGQSRLVPPGEGIGIELEYLVRGTCSLPLPSDPMPGVDWGRDGSTHVLPGEGEMLTQPERNEVRLFLKFGAWARLERVLDHLRDYSGSSYATCGMHVHLDCRDCDREAALARYKRLRSALPWMLEVVATYRKESAYCKPNGPRTVPTRDRYMAVNWLAYDTNRTIECRFHHSTLDARKIVRFVNLVRWVSRHTVNLPTLEAFLGSSAPNTLKVWVLGRIIRLNPDTIRESDMLLSELASPPEKSELPLTGEQLRYYKAMGPYRRRR